MLRFQQLAGSFHKIMGKPKVHLVIANVLLVFFLILLSNLGVLPLKKTGDFAFFTVLTLILALYRPSWVFLFFIGAIALENINLAPENLGIAVRSYQFLGGITALALIIRLALKKLNFEPVKLVLADYALVLVAAAGFISGIGAADKGLALKLSVIFVSFVLLYFLARNYIQTADDLRKIIPFFLSSSVVVVLYGIWQNVRFMKGLQPFEIMPGRPNATFAEADWLGVYLVFLTSFIYALLYYFKNGVQKNAGEKSRSLKILFLYFYLALTFVLLIITVSRSAWLGALAVAFVFLFAVLTNLSSHFKKWQWKNFLFCSAGVSASFIVSIGAVYFFNLTNFQIFNRAQSVVLGLQKITVSCPKNIDCALPKVISGAEDLNQCGCRHINLEDIKKEKLAGNTVLEVFRSDPNVNIRGEIYKKSWAEIKKHPILGIGWGNIAKVLGTDERGAKLNASNIFLEVWLGAGIIGLLAFLLVWLYLMSNGVRIFLKSDSAEEKTAGIFIIAGLVAFLIPNLFNSGILLGILWLFFALAGIKLRINQV